MERKVLWILGLNHTGTTIVWRAFRKDGRFLAYDEPFVENVGHYFPGNNEKGTFDEYLDIFRDPREFWDIFSPICPLQELESNFTEKQERYISYLISKSSSNIVVDETKLHHHLRSISEIDDKSYIIHLVRGARSFVTSHCLPSGRYIIGYRKVVNGIRRYSYAMKFWRRMKMLPGMRREDVIGRTPWSKFGIMLSDAGYDAKRIMSSPAIVRLLAYWHYHYHYLEEEGPKVFGDRFKTVWYEDFANNPQKVMNESYQWLAMEPPKGVRYDDVHPPKPAYRENDPRWREAARIAGFSEEELETLL